MIREQEIPKCPNCHSSDRVEAMRGDLSDLANWWCGRCNSRLSALPALAATGKVSEADLGQKPRRGRKKEEGVDDAQA